jgi:hypothetical protein
MKAVRTSETSVFSIETTRRYIAEVCHLHTRRRENLKYHIFCACPKQSRCQGFQVFIRYGLYRKNYISQARSITSLYLQTLGKLIPICEVTLIPL